MGKNTSCTFPVHFSIVGQCIRNEIDIALSDFTLTRERTWVIDYPPVIEEAIIRLYIKNPAESLNWMAYTEPVMNMAWMGIVCFLLITPPIMAGIFYYGNVLISRRYNSVIESNFSSTS